MADQDPYIEHSSEGGAAGDLSPTEAREVLVGPATEHQQNVLTFGILPIACWRVDEIRFDFGSSFVLPQIAAEVAILAKLREKHKKQPSDDAPAGSAGGAYPPLSIFGHADPVGDDEQNKQLSGRRATAIYALLIRNTDLWEQLFSNSPGGDTWGVKSIQVMLGTLGFPCGPVDGSFGPNTSDAVKRFQQANGLPADGQPGPQTRSKLFLAYMDKLCGDLKLDRVEDFLARGADAEGKGDRQGCGEFNPVLLFSQNQEDEFAAAQSKQRRNALNAPNRRVVALLFRPGSRVEAARWPCPRVKEDSAGCKKRFWSDGEKRRSEHLPDQQRRFEETQDTFACRFYHRMTTNSPCEAGLAVFRIRLFDRFGRALPHAPYQVVLAGQEMAPGTADENGDIVIRNVTVPTSCIVRWSRPPEDDFPLVYGEADDVEVPSE